jgi:hypothetical protein
VRFVAELSDNQDEANTGPGDAPYNGYPTTNSWVNRGFVSWTPDGDGLVFATSAKVTGYDTGGFKQIYRYDLAEGLSCLSCPEGPPTADAMLAAPAVGQIPGHARPIALSVNNAISDDGRRVFFTSPDALVPHDVNRRFDAYVWQDGEVHLLSDGVSSLNARFVAASPDGRDAFFTTRAKLVVADDDDLADVYDARIGGGFPEPDHGRPGCAGDSCQGDAGERPDVGAPVSGSPDDQVGGERQATRGSVRALLAVGRGQRLVLARGGRARVRVRVGGRGRVVVSASAKVEGRRRLVARGATFARGAGIVSVRLRLSRVAAARLRRDGRLSLRLTARIGEGAARSRTLRLVLPKRSARAGGTSGAGR